MERENLTFAFLSAIRLPVQDSLQVGDYLDRQNGSVPEYNAWFFTETCECREYKCAVDSKRKEVCFR